MTDYERDTQIISNCIDIIEAEKKPLKKKPSAKTEAWRKVGKHRDKLEMDKLLDTNDTSELEAYFETL